MRRAVAALVLIALLAVATVRADEDDENVPGSALPSDDSEVIMLTDQNFDEVTSQGTWIIEFFAPWCGHCKKLRPIWEESAVALLGKVKLGAVDCTENKALTERFEIKSYPTLKFWRDGEARVFRGERTKEAIVKFGLDVSRAPVEDVDAKSLPAVLDSSPVTFLLVTSDSGDSKAASKAFERVAYQLQGLHRFVSAEEDKAIMKKYNLKKTPAVVALMEAGDDDAFTGPWLETSLRTFVDAHKLPILSDLDQTNFEDVTGSGNLVVFAATDPAVAITKAYRKTLISAAKKYRQFVFANVNGVKYIKYVEQFGVYRDKIPTVFALNYTGELYYTAPNGDRVANEVQLVDFLEGILDGRIPSRGTSAWYSPGRYYRAFEKWLGSFNESQLAMGVTICMVVFTVVIFAGCYYAARDISDTVSTAEQKAKAAAGGTSSGSGATKASGKNVSSKKKTS